MIPTHSKIGQGMRIHFEKLLDEYGNNELIPVCERMILPISPELGSEV